MQADFREKRKGKGTEVKIAVQLYGKNEGKN